MELFDLEKMKQVIQAMPETKFDSHRFIKAFSKLYEREYIVMLKPQRGGYRKLHSAIGRFLLLHQKELGICKIEIDSSENVKGYNSKNAVWKKSNCYPYHELKKKKMQAI